MTPTVFHSLDEAKLRFEPSALAIGNLDGVHIGHQALLRRTLAAAAERDFQPSVLTFHPHPTAVTAPERTPDLITTLEEKLRILGSLGVRQVMVLPFTAEIAGMNPEEFVSQILLDALKTRIVLVGENFRFGHKQAGTPEVLEDLGYQFGFDSQFLHPITLRGEVASSSVVRQHLHTGNMSRAARLLNRWFFVEGPVVSGHGVGAKQTVPTLNLLPAPGQILPRAVYVTETWDPTTRRRWPSITNAGVRPTFGGEDLTIETYLLSPLEGRTPERIQVQFHRFIRAEQQFPDPAALKEQILRDVARAQTYWRRMSRVPNLTPSLY